MQGLIIVNAYPNGEKFIRQAERIAEELRAIGVAVEVIKNGDIHAVIDEKGGVVSFAKSPNFIVYLDKDKYLGRALQQKGFRLFNRAETIEICDDKVTTYLALQNAGVRLAKTIPAPLCYTPNEKNNPVFLQKVVQELSLPVVVKKSYGSFGAGVFLAKTMEELQNIADEWLYAPHCYQQFFPQSAGRDIRVIVIGGKTVGAMERVAKKGEFRSNIELGGQGRNIALSPSYAQVAEKVAKTLHLDYCGVDLLETEEGVVVCEVNSNAFFEGMEKTTGVNIAKAYAEYIVREMTTKLR